SFVFTRCTGPCPQVTGTVARLLHELRSLADVRFVTFTVDPERDRPYELQEYAARYNADPERWLFLTGSQDEIYELLTEKFHVGVQQNKGAERTPGNEVTHSTRLVVVDRKGHIRGYFSGIAGVEPGEREEFEENLKKLQEKVTALIRE